VHVDNTRCENVTLEVNDDSALGEISDLTTDLDNDTAVDQQVALERLTLAVKDMSVLEKSRSSAVDEAWVACAGLGRRVDVLVLAVYDLALGDTFSEMGFRDTGDLEMDLVVGEFVGGAKKIGRGCKKGYGGGGQEQSALLAEVDDTLLAGSRTSIEPVVLVLRKTLVICHFLGDDF
jgi:hypothetical protein